MQKCFYCNRDGCDFWNDLNIDTCGYHSDLLKGFFQIKGFVNGYDYSNRNEPTDIHFTFLINWANTLSELSKKQRGV